MKKGENFGEAGMEGVWAWCNFTLRRCQEVKRIIKGFFEFRQNSHTYLPMLGIDVIRQTWFCWLVVNWLCCHRPGTYYVTIGLVAMYHVQQSFVFEHRRHLGQWWDLPLTKREHWWKVEKYFEQSRLPTGAWYIWYELWAWQHKPAKLDQTRSNVFFYTYQFIMFVFYHSMKSGKVYDEFQQFSCQTKCECLFSAHSKLASCLFWFIWDRFLIDKKTLC